jgi:hypothetical protein
MKRKIIDAEKSAPEIAREAVQRVRALYAVERQAKDASITERLKIRREQQRRCWRSCRIGFFSGGNSCWPSIPWPRRSAMLWANGTN